MKKLIPLFAMTLFCLQSPAQTPDILISIGQETALPLLGENRVWIEKRELIKAKNKGQSILVRGQKRGSTQMRIGQRLTSIHIVSESEKQFYTDLLEFQKNKLGLQIEIQDGYIHIKGDLFTKKYYDQIRNLSQGASYQLMANMPIQVAKEILNEIQNALAENNLPLVFIQRKPKWQIFLSPKDPRFEKYQKVLEKYGVTVAADANAISSQPLIRVQVTVAEIKREFSRKWGIRWPEMLSAQVLPTTSDAVSPAFAQVQFIENQGHGKVLASPTLLVKSGDEATFQAGGEIPIKIINLRSQNVEWKSYGIQLKIKPKSDISGRIELEIDTRVSNIIAASSIDGIPSLSTHQVKSTFSVNEPRTIILSGLIRNEDANNSQGLPILSQIPVLGALFASKDFRENRSELFIFVRPEIVHEQETLQSGHLRESL